MDDSRYKTGNMLLDNQSKVLDFDWFQLQTIVRAEVRDLIKPFKNSLTDSEAVSDERYDYVLKLEERLKSCEAYCRIEKSEIIRENEEKTGKRATNNRFDLIEDLIANFRSDVAV